MKRLFCISALLSLFSCCGSTAKPPVGTPISYEYTYSGTMANPIQWYKVEIAADGTLNLSHSADTPQISVYRCPADMLERIGEMVRKYKLYTLKNDYRPKLQVLDGYGWTVFINYGDESISSGGSNAWPDSKLLAGISAINSMLAAVIESAAPEDIIATR